MEVKKTPKADLKNKKLLFTEIGMVAALGIVLGAFEWSSSEKQVATLEDTTKVQIEDEMIAIQQDPSPAARGSQDPCSLRSDRHCR